MITGNALQNSFDQAPMSATQVRVIAFTVLLSALDGYDVLSATFAAPAISAQWHVGRGEMGVMLSAGLFGMAGGSFLLGPLGDRIGRKTLVILSLALMAVGMLMAALSGSVATLAAWRAVAGLGIGACVTVINPLAAEFSNARRRPLAIALMAMGYPIGGVIGGLLSAILLRSIGWEAIFLTGFILSALLLPVALLILPESPMFLAQRQPAQALDRLNAVLSRCGKPLLDALPAAQRRASTGYRGLFTVEQRRTTVGLAIANILYATAAYYVLSWLPQMVTDAGFQPADGSLASAGASVVGVVGGIMLGWLASRLPVIWLTAGCTIGLAIALAGFGMVPPSWSAVLAAAGMMGLFLYAGVSGFYAVLAQAFDASVRATGVGFVMGCGRVASAVAPLVAGALFAAGAGRAAVSLSFALASLLAGLTLVLTFWTPARSVSDVASA